MAASSGVFAETIGGPTSDEGGGEAAEGEAVEGDAATDDGNVEKKGGMFGGLFGKKKDAAKDKKPTTKKTPTKKTPTKKPAGKSKFTLEGAAITSGDDIAWALLGFILVALLILI
jgi:hypothetical protein